MESWLHNAQTRSGPSWLDRKAENSSLMTTVEWMRSRRFPATSQEQERKILVYCTQLDMGLATLLLWKKSRGGVVVRSDGWTAQPLRWLTVAPSMLSLAVVDIEYCSTASQNALSVVSNTCLLTGAVAPGGGLSSHLCTFRSQPFQPSSIFNLSITAFHDQ